MEGSVGGGETDGWMSARKGREEAAGEEFITEASWEKRAVQSGLSVCIQEIPSVFLLPVSARD